MKSVTVLSPFCAGTYEEQQQKWLEWRSQMLTYKNCAVNDTEETGNKLPPVIIPVPMKMPEERMQASVYRHAQLDSLYAKHNAAGKNAINWQSANFTANSAGE